MNRRIKIYSTILALVYMVLIGYEVSKGIADFKSGFETGMSTYEDKNTPIKTIDMLHFKVEPVAGRYTFPETVNNILTGQQVSFEGTEYKLKIIDSPIQLPLYLQIFKIVRNVLSIAVAIFLLYIPFLFFSIIKSVTKDKIIDSIVIKKIQRIGWLLVSFFIYDLIFYQIGERLICDHLVKLDNYKIITDFSDCTMLILGLVTLVMSEILKISLKLKEDQDFTI